MLMSREGQIKRKRKRPFVPKALEEPIPKRSWAEAETFYPGACRWFLHQNPNRPLRWLFMA